VSDDATTKITAQAVALDDARGSHVHRPEVSDAELCRVMQDFLEMGHVENIVAMYKQDPRYYDWTGRLLDDERFAVRLGVSVLFEYLREARPKDIGRAVPSLARALEDERPWIRGEAVSVLGIIATPEAVALLRKAAADPDPQVREVAADLLEGIGDA